MQEEDYWIELVSRWVSRDVEGIVAVIAGMSRSEAEDFTAELEMLIRLVTEAKDVL